MFFNLAWRNAKRSRNENLIYFLTLVTAVASFYIVLSLGQQDVIRFLGKIERDAVKRLLTTLMPTVYLCALLLLFFLVIFADKYQMECRSRELGLYLILGMKKKRLFVQIMAESLITSVIALCGGIAIGGFLSEIISLTTARLVGQGVIIHQSSLSLGGIIWTIIGFLLVQSIALFILSAKLFKRELYELLYGEVEKKQNVGTVSGELVLLALGVVTLFIAYWIVINCFMKLGGAMLVVAVLFGIAGTVLSIRGLARLISILAGSVKKKSTDGLYTFTLRQFQENIANKYISISAASILIMLAIILISDGSVSIISNGNQLTRGAAVYDFTVTGENKSVKKFLTSDIMKPYVKYLNQMEIGELKYPSDNSSTSLIDWGNLKEKIKQQMSAEEYAKAKDALCYGFSSDNSPALNLFGAIETSSAPTLIPVSAYNRLLIAAGEDALTLSDNEAVFYLNPDSFGDAQAAAKDMIDHIAENNQTDKNALIAIDGKPLYLIPYVPLKGLTADENVRVFTAFIVSDELFKTYVNTNSCITYWNFCLPKELIEKDGLMLSIMNVNEILKPSGLSYESYLNNYGRRLFYVVSEGYTMLYMGFMFLIIACALLALQFLTQMQVTKKRYLTLSMLGAKREQMKKSIHKQVLCFFLLPILLACVSGTVGLYAMQVNLHTSTMNGEKLYPLLFVMAGVVIFVLVIYAVAVARTADYEIAKLQWKTNL